jgi:hypothetical protein
MAMETLNDLFDHNGHGVEAVTYKDGARSIECPKCKEVLSDDVSHEGDRFDTLWTYYTAGPSPFPKWAAVKKAWKWPDAKSFDKLRASTKKAAAKASKKSETKKPVEKPAKPVEKEVAASGA